MNVRFQIKPLSGKADMEGKEVLRFTGESEPYRRKATRRSDKIGVDPQGNPIVRFVTGIDPHRVRYCNWYNDEEQKLLKQQIEESLEDLQDRFGGKEVLEDTNIHFWKKGDKEIYQIPLTITTKTQFFDTKNADHAMLYFGIAGGAFIDQIAPTKEFAEVNRISHYLSLESELDDEEFEDVNETIEAFSNLSRLAKEEGDALFILAWTALYNTKGFRSILKSTPKRELMGYLKEYIEGALVDKKKKQCAKNFNEYVAKWDGQLTRVKLLTEAYIKAGEQYAFIVTNMKKYETSWGTSLGNTIDEAIEKISMKKASDDLLRLRQEVDKKWLM